MSRIKQILQNNNSNGDSLFADWLLSNGQTFIPVCETKSYAGYEETIKQCKRRRCFENSITVAALHGFEYYEGFYLFSEAPDIPLAHAFNVKDGLVYDFTSKRFKSKPIEWFGVKIPMDKLAYLIKKIDERKVKDNTVLLEYWFSETLGELEDILRFITQTDGRNPFNTK